MQVSDAYQACLTQLAAALTRQPAPGPALRVAVDGRSGVGKTTFGAALAAALERAGRPARLISLDGFHHPRARRYARGRYSAEGYYRDARDLNALIDYCLAPLGADGSGRYAEASFDLDADTALDPEWRQAEPGLIAVVEGTFLQQPALRAYWDAAIFLHAPADVARDRGMTRDADLLGAEVEALYRQRYEGAFDLYRAESAPETQADWRVDMTDLTRPVLYRAHEKPPA